MNENEENTNHMREKRCVCGFCNFEEAVIAIYGIFINQSASNCTGDAPFSLSY
jgi:hypothetical protein